MDKRQKRLNYVMKKKQNLTIITKEIPDEHKQGGLDPEVKRLLINQLNNEADKEESFQEFDLEAIRASMGFENVDLAPDVKIEKKVIKLKNKEVVIRIYHRENDVIKPALIFFHGGGFIGGSLKVVENPCKYLAMQANCVVISVDYRLAPEHPFPAGLEDCYDVVKWVSENANSLSIDSNYIGVAGDSAGANLAIGCSALDAKENNIIKYQSLIYPGVNFSSTTQDEYEWSFDDYDMGPDEEIIRLMLTQFSSLSDTVSKLYVPKNKDAQNPLISPIFSQQMDQLPRTSIVIAEFDYLKVEGKVYAEKLANHGVCTKLIEYKGMDHAFVDKLGIYSQAEDCLIEIAKDFLDKRSV